MNRQKRLVLHIRTLHHDCADRHHVYRVVHHLTPAGDVRNGGAGHPASGSGSSIPARYAGAATGTASGAARSREFTFYDILQENVPGSYEPSGEQTPEWAFVSLETELWVIAKADPVLVLDEDTPDPGSGALVANMPSEDEALMERKRSRCPCSTPPWTLPSAGHISTVRVKQQFANPFDTKIEAVYVFPLPEKAAVTGFLMIIGERTIRGILREKEEAEAIYRAARDQGYQASLLVQRRPNIFEQKVANIEPGKAIDVDITYFSTLAYKDGWYSFVFPTVVGPRFNPPGHPDPVHALPRGGRTTTPGGTALEYLAPTERSGHDLGITVSIDAGVPIEEITSTHEITVERDGPASATVQLATAQPFPTVISCWTSASPERPSNRT